MAKRYWQQHHFGYDFRWQLVWLADIVTDLWGWFYDWHDLGCWCFWWHHFGRHDFWFVYDDAGIWQRDHRRHDFRW
jgi:hypothetical protein